jgi:hypothetical protein
MIDIFKLQERSKIKKAWAVNKSIMRDELDSKCTSAERTIRSSIRFEDLFDGTLGIWDTELVYLELKDDTKP